MAKIYLRLYTLLIRLSKKNGGTDYETRDQNRSTADPKQNVETAINSLARVSFY